VVGSRVNFTSRRRSHFFELNGRIPSRARQNQFSLIQNNEAPRGGHAPRGEVRAIQAARRQREVAMTDKKTPDDINPIPRRSFLVGAGTAVAASLTPAEPAQAQQAKPAAAPAAASEPEAYLTLTAPEAAFLSAAVDAFIPADELTPSGSECGVVTFIDRQLASAWGGGAKMYRQGPFRKAKAEYGYQLPLTPRQFFEAGIVAVNAWTRKVHGKDFDRLPAKERDDALKALEQGKAELGDFDGKPFFEALLQITMEGFFADPIYGGNRNKVSWKMVGFPGLPAVYANLIEEYRTKRYVAEPQSIADFS
jgi:gluconate 2-dehydrogenase gamma chain